MSKYGLGKGLGALIPQNNEPTGPAFQDEYAPPAMSATPPQPAAEEKPDMARVMKVPVADIMPNPYQPRKIFNPDALQELADSIREHGILQPLTVTQSADGKYELLAGERRLEACRLLGLEEVPVIVRTEPMDDKEKLELALIENIQRQDLNLIEQARAFKKLHEEFGLTYDQVSAKLGKSRPVISNIVRLLQLPAEIQRGIMDGKLNEGHARGLLQVADRDRQMALYNLILEKKLTSEQAMVLGKEWTARPHLLKTSPKSDETTMLENHLRAKLGAKRLRIDMAKNGGGTIKIMFLSDDELRSLVDRINSIS